MRYDKIIYKMIQKIIVLLTIYLFFISNFEYSINSLANYKNCLSSSNIVEHFDKKNIKKYNLNMK